MTNLNTRLLQAHAAGDTKSISALYEEAADAATDDDAAGFFLTHAYVHALEAGLPSVEQLRDRLIKMGRDVPQG
ncbi:hypothetical protein [Roseibium sp. RKSG952]|uniref:hypothetical protein n=1 Tax=Roseibium sp. RKSG952 TaxID=2529384 RepID=UPI0012BD45CF|nr:hypothetical protein [Roseibium sp. RKSG952]MTI03542.1 hypothetical protein [Roseibium sp. RKSG952]